MRTELLNRDLGRKAILNMDKDGDGLLSRLEFFSHMVVALKLCTKQHLQAIMERFDEIEHSREARVLVMTELAKLRRIKSSISEHHDNGGDADWSLAKDVVAQTMQTKLLLQGTVKGAQVMENRELRIHSSDFAPATLKKRRSSFVKHEAAKDSDCILVDLAQANVVTEEQKKLHQAQSDRRSTSTKRIVRNTTLRTTREVSFRGNTTKQGCVHPFHEKSSLHLAKVYPAAASTTKTTETKLNCLPSAGDSSYETKQTNSNDNDNRSGPAVDVEVDPEEREQHPLSKMLAHMRRARDISRVYVQEQATKTDKKDGELEHARIAISAYRDLLESLHRQQTFAHDLLHPQDPEVLRLHEVNASLGT
jgi:hypothetical protein